MPGEVIPLNLGHLIEGVVECDPMTGVCHIRMEPEGGKVKLFDVQAALRTLEGKEVRLTLVTFDDLDILAKMVENKLD